MRLVLIATGKQPRDLNLSAAGTTCDEQ